MLFDKYNCVTLLYISSQSHFWDINLSSCPAVIVNQFPLLFCKWDRDQVEQDTPPFVGLQVQGRHIYLLSTEEIKKARVLRY